MKSFYEEDGSYLRATPLTRGPWSEDAQHGGPPLALLGRAIEHAAGDGFVSRITGELLRPIPISSFTIDVEVLRSGRKARLIQATLRHEGTACAKATGLVLLENAVYLPVGLPRPRLKAPAQCEPFDFTFFPNPVGYQSAMEMRIIQGIWGSGAAVAWLRMRVPLVLGEEPSPLQRVLVAADAGNGVSAPLPIEDYAFINPDLTVYVHRRLRGEWVGLDGITRVEPNGVGLAQAELHDEEGPIGRSLQGLLVGVRHDIVRSPKS